MKTCVPARELARVRTRWVDCAFLQALGALSLSECHFSQFPRDAERPRARTKTFESIDAATTGRRELDVRSSLLFAYLFPDYIFVPVDVRGGSRSLDDGPSNQSGTECISANAARIHPSIHPFIERIHRSRSPAVPRREGGQNV